MRNILKVIYAGAMAIAFVGAAFAQGTVQQSGPVTAGHVPLWVQNGIVKDAGGANGGAAGTNPSEQGLTIRSSGTAPYANAGTGPLNANDCNYDAPTTNATGYHYLCFSPNAQGGGLIAYGSGGSATPLPLGFIINGTSYPIPAGGFGTVTQVNTSGGVTGGPITTTGTVSLASIATSTVLGNVSGISATPTALTPTQITTLCNTFTSSLKGCVAASGGGTTNFLRADGTWVSPGGGGSPGGVNGSIQYNDSGSFNGSSAAKVDSSGNGTLNSVDVTGGTLPGAAEEGIYRCASKTLCLYTNGATKLQIDTNGYINGSVIKMDVNSQATYFGINSGTVATVTDIKNTAFGKDTLAACTTIGGPVSCAANTAIGYRALTDCTQCNNATGLGDGAIFDCTTCADIVGVGEHALLFTTTGTQSTCVGSQCGSTAPFTGTLVNCTGYQACQALTSAANDNFIGGLAAGAATTAANDNCVGYRCMANLTTQADSSCVGTQCLFSGAATSVAIGSQSGLFATGSGDVFIGYQAGENETGSNKLYIANSNTANPLIGGDFSANTLVFNASGGISMKGGIIATVATPTVAASQVGYGNTTAASSSCGSLSGAAGCLQINVAGTARYVPFY